jgi:glycosyltransferase involved in cell wall biosynthesis
MTKHTHTHTHTHTPQKSSQSKVSTLSFAVVGLARNCGQTISDDIHRINKALKDATSVVWLIVESDSNDDTVQKLENLQSELPNFHFATLGKLANTIPKRTDRISYCRNYYAEELRNNPSFSNVDYVVVADLDGLNSKLTNEAFESCWLRDDWDMCAANQAGPYYDIWALRHKEWCPDDCWAQYKFLNTYRLDFERNLWASVYSKMITISKETEWIEVDSAFGGFAIYKKKMFDDCRYVGITEAGEEFCEHVYFHRILKANGAKLFINPQLINAGFTEHTVGLLWKNRVKRQMKSKVKEVLIKVFGKRNLLALRRRLKK